MTFDLDVHLGPIQVKFEGKVRRHSIRIFLFGYPCTLQGETSRLWLKTDLNLKL